MSPHPLIELAADRDVRQAKGFRKAATGLSGEGLEAHYKTEVECAPRRKEAGKKYFAAHPGGPPKEAKAGKEGEHLAAALVALSQSGEGLELPSGGPLTFLDYKVPLQSKPADKALGDDDPNKGVGRIDLLGLMPDDRVAVVALKFLPADATRGGTGDTPLRALLEGLANAAIVDANREALQEEIVGKVERTLSEEAPVLILLGSPRYWELCRKREAQKGAGWIRELERLGREIAQDIGVEVFFLAVDLDGDPGWSYGDDGPTVQGEPELLPAWELGAGKLKPKPRPKAKTAAEDEIVEADLSREVRVYKITESYDPGDRIKHPTLGTGVVQNPIGPGKIKVLFDDKQSLLVHERPSPS